MNLQEIRSKTELEIPRATGSLREVQLRMLDILLEVKRLCNKHDIRYWLDFGTLLGAVRHAGFIPWDDDLDVCVLEDDFERFLRVCSEELPDWLVLQTEKTEKDSGMGAGLVKIRDKNSLYIHDFDSFRSDYSKGIFIDVFKSVRYPEMPSGLFCYLSRRVSFAYGFWHYHLPISMKNIICYCVYPFSYCFHKAIFEFLGAIKKKRYLFSTPERYVYGLYTPEDEIFPLSEIDFEGHLFPVPRNWDRRLCDSFGDYLKIPEKTKRRTHAKYVFLDKGKGVIEY